MLGFAAGEKGGKLKMKVGCVAEAWLYPVKSMAGQQVDSLELDLLGVIGDRSWTMLDAASGDIAWGKRFPALMDLAASYVDQRPVERVFGDAVPPVAIHLPDGTQVSSERDADGPISAYVGKDLRLSPLQPSENRDHYAWTEPLDAEAIMQILGIGPGEDPPDLSVYDDDLIALLSQYFSPPGTYNDMAPLHVLTTASIRYMQERSGETFDRRRFRPNFLIDTESDVEGLAEFSWVGRTLLAGEAVLKVEAKTIRCSMPARPQAPCGLEANPKVARALYEETGRFLGAYLSVQEPGRIRRGDAVVLLD